MKIYILALSIFYFSTAWGQDTTACRESDIGIIEFKNNSARLTSAAKKKLDSMILIINRNKDCQVIATGYSADMCDKCDVLSWDRVQSVSTYFIRKGVKSDRMLGASRLEGNLNIVSLALTQYMRQTIAPYPKLRRNRLR